MVFTLLHSRQTIGYGAELLMPICVLVLVPRAPPNQHDDMYVRRTVGRVVWGLQGFGDGSPGEVGSYW
jgi:hypothetical protein